VPGELRLGDGRRLLFHHAVVVPPFVGAEVVRTSGLGNPGGFVEVQDTYQTKAFPSINAVGVGTAVSVPWQTANPVGVPKTGFRVSGDAQLHRRLGAWTFSLHRAVPMPSQSSWRRSAAGHTPSRGMSRRPASASRHPGGVNGSPQ
jgi:hypothetical protein